VSIKEIRRHISRYDGFVGFESAEVTVAHLRRDLESDVEELAQAGIV
jgi:hypothetical protein